MTPDSDLFQIAISGDYGTTEGASSPDLSPLRSQLNRDAFWLTSMDGALIDTLSVQKARKAGPTLGFPATNASALRNSGVSAVTLANNHIMDFGKQGLQSTLSQLKNQNLLFLGAGLSKDAADLPLTIERGTNRVAILNVGENQFGVARRNGAPGISDMEDPALPSRISALSKSGWTPIVICHAGSEGFPLPAPQLRDHARNWVYSGACAVLFHHPHVIQGIESIAGAPVLYSLGDLYFYPLAGPEKRAPELTAVLNFKQSRLVGWSWISHESANNGLKVTGTSDSPGSTGQLISALNQALGANYEALWQAQSLSAFNQHYAEYFGSSFGSSNQIKDWRSRIKFLLRPYRFKANYRNSPELALLALVLIRCPSHRWMIQEALSLLGMEHDNKVAPEAATHIEKLIHQIRGES
jgi:hypothetical protein